MAEGDKDGLLRRDGGDKELVCSGLTMSVTDRQPISFYTLTN